MEVEAVGDSYKIRRSSAGRGLAERVHAAKLKLDAERMIKDADAAATGGGVGGAVGGAVGRGVGENAEKENK